MDDLSSRPRAGGERLLREQVRLLFQHVPTMQAAAFAVALVLAYSVRPAVEPGRILEWLALLLLVALGRAVLYRRFRAVRGQAFAPVRWARAYLAVSVFSGACWGASAFIIFPAGNLALVSLFLLVLAGLSAGATVSHSAVRLAPAAWAGPALLPYAVRCAMEGGETSYTVAVLIVVYLATILGYSSTHHAVITDAITLRFANLDLLEELRQANATLKRELAERERAEAALRAGELERQRLEAQLAQSQRIEAVGRLAGGVAHDYNNMLSVIMGHAELALLEAGPDDPVHRDLEQILGAARRSAGLTGQLLAFARRQPVKPRVLDLNETIQGMIGMLRRLIGEHIDLRWVPGSDLWTVRIDPSQFDQILTNLAVNARDALAGTGQVRIETANVVFDEAFCAGHVGAVQGEYVRLTVADTGSGISPEIIGRVFEPFFTTKAPGQGTGLGLSTVYGIVKQNGGFITVESRPGKGATFAIALPRSVGPVSEPVVAAESAGSVPTGDETVLIVEDAESVLNTARPMLSRLGYTVLAASSPADAIRLVESHDGDIHLVVTDLVMPEMNGRQLAARLTALRPMLKCLFMSGYSTGIVGHDGVVDDATNFVQKPFSMTTLAASVRQALDGE